MTNAYCGKELHLPLNVIVRAKKALFLVLGVVRRKSAIWKEYSENWEGPNPSHQKEANMDTVQIDIGCDKYAMDCA